MLTLRVLPASYAIWQLPSDTPLPAWPDGAFVCVIRTASELSGVCPSGMTPAGAMVDDGWRCLQFVGPFDLTLTGIMVRVAQPLATAGVPIFTLATYNTDYILVPNSRYAEAVVALTAAGHQIVVE
jgi:hypothetical protein